MSLDTLRLVPSREEHVDFWLALRSEPLSRRMLPLEPETREGLLKRLREASSDVTDPNAKSFRWMVELDGRLIGTVSARELSRVQGRIEVGYMLSGEYVGRGIGSRAVALVLDRLFSMPVLHRVWLTTSAHNLASQGLARKLGFTLEGVMRQHFVIDGQRQDQQVWGLLRPEWEVRRPLLGLPG